MELLVGSLISGVVFWFVLENSQAWKIAAVVAGLALLLGIAAIIANTNGHRIAFGLTAFFGIAAGLGWVRQNQREKARGIL